MSPDLIELIKFIFYISPIMLLFALFHDISKDMKKQNEILISHLNLMEMMFKNSKISNDENLEKIFKRIKRI